MAIWFQNKSKYKMDLVSEKEKKTFEGKKNWWLMKILSIFLLY